MKNQATMEAFSWDISAAQNANIFLLDQKKIKYLVYGNILDKRIAQKWI
jgi:hypothetical protein